MADSTAPSPPPPPPPAQASALCVAWSPAGVEIDQRLRAALKRPGLEVAVCDDPYAALACLAYGHEGGATAKILLLIEPARLPHLAEVLDLTPRYVPNLALWQFDPTRQPVLRAMKMGDALAIAGVVQPPPPTAISSPAPAPPLTAEPARMETRRAPTIAPQRADEGRANKPASAVEWTGPWAASSTQKWSEGGSSGLRLAGEGTLPAQEEVDAFAQAGDANGSDSTSTQPAKPNPRVLSDEELAMLLGDEPPSPSRKGAKP